MAYSQYETDEERTDIMPTGYTSRLYDGEEQSFADFAMECARAFGALVELRDEPSAPIPEKFEPYPWHERELGKAQVRMREIRGWTPAKADFEARREYDRELADWEKALAESKARFSRYTAMLEQVRAWTPPTSEHEEMKRFMTDQLQKSIDFDTGHEPDRPELEPGPEFARESLAQAERDVAYHAKYMAEDIERAQGRTAWVQALRESLGIEHA
jgi:hypothetical protein